MDSPLVITVHGINSDGEWQEQIESVIGPFCECRMYRYRDYRYAGFLLQFFHPYWLLFAIGCASYGCAAITAETDPVQGGRTYDLPGRWWALIPLVSAFVSLLIAIRLARREFRTEPNKTGKSGWCLPVLLLLTVAGTVWLAVSLNAFHSTADSLALFMFLLLAVSLYDQLTLAWLWVVLACFLIVGVLCLWALPAHWICVLCILLLGVVWILVAVLWDGLIQITRLIKTWAIPFGLTLLSAVIGYCAWCFTREGHSDSIVPDLAGSVAFGLAAVAFPLAMWRARHRRRACSNRFDNWIQDQQKEHDGPIQIIAHSFGTWLTGQLLASRRVKVDRVILVGSVLPVAYPWDGVLHNHHSAEYGSDADAVCHSVRHEIGERDPVVFCTGVLELVCNSIGWTPVFGAAGRDGFNPDPDYVHQVRNSLDYCENCLTHQDWKQPRVHNVFLPTFRHSDATRVLERAERFWLPFLRHLDPWEYWDFRRLCQHANAIQIAITSLDEQLKKAQEAVRETDAERHMIDHANPETDPDKRERAKKAYDGALERSNDILGQLRGPEKQQVAVEDQIGTRSWHWTFDGPNARTMVLKVHLKERIIKGVFLGWPTLMQAHGQDPKMAARIDSAAVDGARTAIKLMWQSVAQAGARIDEYRLKLQEDTSAEHPSANVLELLDPELCSKKAIEQVVAQLGHDLNQELNQPVQLDEGTDAVSDTGDVTESATIAAELDEAPESDDPAPPEN